ncbi:DUF2608 domain-containing protein, partial [Candidatus Babeliales bacterium]|nr:DUF2608 domain-containing protein [Candidatus Babeliales bacterium]
MKKMSIKIIGLVFVGVCGLGAWSFWNKKESLKYPIQEIFSFKKVSKEFDAADEKTLILFDVDETIMTAEDYFPKWKKFPIWFFKFLMWKFESIKDLTFRREIMSLIHLQVKRKLIEPEVAKTINQLCSRGVPVLGLTALKTGRFGVIKNIPELRFNTLKNIGITFSKSFKYKVFDTFNQKFKDGLFDSLADYQESFPMLYKGILCTNRQDKGSILKAFIENFGFKPSKVIFFDDVIKRLQSVGNACGELNIPCFLFHYRGAERFPGKWNTLRIIKQFECMIKERRWISDKEADGLVSRWNPVRIFDI